LYYDEELSDIQEGMLDEMPDRYSKIKGTWLWEMFKAFAIKIYELLELLTDTASKLDIENIEGDELDAYVGQWTDLKRKQAVRAEGTLKVVGSGVLYKNSVVSADGILFYVNEDTEITETGYANITAAEAGTSGNVAAGTITTLVTSNANITSVTNEEATAGGTDEETDASLRERYRLRLSMPATSGNKAHYILWARECDGVGGAKAARDTSVNNKVNLYICGDDGGVADSEVIEGVQEYIDPNINGDGSGVAPIGAICEVFSADVKALSLDMTVEPDRSVTAEQTAAAIRSALNSYLMTVNFRKTEISYAKMLNVVLSSSGVNDVKSFTVNGGYANIECEETEIFVITSFDCEVEE